jgi:hypothetical protein
MEVHPRIAILIDVECNPDPPVKKLLVVSLRRTAPQAVPYLAPSCHPRLSRWWRWQANPRGEERYPPKEKITDKAAIAKVLMPTHLARCQLRADRCK